MKQHITKMVCILFGHRFINLDTDRFTADCKRCKRKYEVSYDMAYGETYAVREAVKEKLNK
jgi:hypothetical protein